MSLADLQMLFNALYADGPIYFTRAISSRHIAGKGILVDDNFDKIDLLFQVVVLKCRLYILLCFYSEIVDPE